MYELLSEASMLFAAALPLHVRASRAPNVRQTAMTPFSTA